MQRSIFISYAHEDAHRISKLEQWSKYARLGPGISISAIPVKKKSDASTEPNEAVAGNIAMAEAVVVLIGNTVTPRMESEARLAMEMNKVVVFTRLPYAKGILPEDFAGFPVVSFEPAAIATAISG